MKLGHCKHVFCVIDEMLYEYLMIGVYTMSCYVFRCVLR